MPGYITKGYILKKLDEAFADTADNGKRERFLTGISAKDATNKWKHSLVEVAKAVLPLRPQDEAHLKNHWFNVYSGWWPTQQPIEIVLRHGLIQAITLAGDGKDSFNKKVTPMSCYWVCGVPQFQVISLCTKKQVTVQIMTPEPPVSDRIPHDYVNTPNLEDIFTVRHRSRGPGEVQVSLDEDYVEFVRPKSE
jgi:hypothetical protein